MLNRYPIPIIILALLSIEKFIQHMVVTYAFYADLTGIRQEVVVDYRILIVSGFLVGILFLVNIPYVLQRKRSGYYLLLVLALFDLIGEFIAQGMLFIKLPVSFIVALIILITLIYSRRYFGLTARKG